MNGFGKLLLVATSVAPVLLIYGSGRIGELVASTRSWTPSEVGPALVALSVLVTLFCAWLLRRLERVTASSPLNIETKTVEPIGQEPLTLLVAYAIPVVAAERADLASLFSVGAFSLVLGIMVWNMNLLHLNPVIGILGYKCFSLKCARGNDFVVISKMSNLSGPTLDVIEIGPSSLVLAPAPDE